MSAQRRSQLRQQAAQRNVIQKQAGPAVAPPSSFPGRPLRVLHLLLAAREQNCYNQFCLGLGERQQISIATFFAAEVRVPPEVRLYEGNGTVAGFLRALRAAFAGAGHDVVHAHGPVDGFLFLLYRMLFGSKRAATLYTAHHSYTNDNLRLHNRLLMVPVFALYQRVVCVGQASLDSFPRAYRRLAGKRLSAIPNGVDLARLDRSLAVMEERRDADRFAVVSVGRLIPIKDPQTVLAGFMQAAVPSSSLEFIGEGPLRGQLAQAAGEAVATAPVALRGLIPREDVYRVLAAADLFVSASHGEGMPMAVLEAMACECPVILSDIPAHREIARDADFIPLVAVGDRAAVAREIRRFAALSPERRAEIGRHCRGIVEERFSLYEMHRRYEESYLHVLGS